MQKEIVEPRIQAMKEARIFREREPIGVRQKEFWELKHTSYILGDRFRVKLGHEPDGLIFQPIHDVSIFIFKPKSHCYCN